MIEEIKNRLKENALEDDWNFHLKIVIEIALKLANIKGADKEIVELAAIFHDFARITISPKDHEVTGAAEAERILSEYNYPKDRIEKIKHCVLAHRSSGKTNPETIEAKCLFDADNLAHIEAVFGVFQAGLKKFGNIKQATEWIDKKIDRDWNKLHFEESREMAKEKYDAAKILIDSMKKYF